MALKRMLVEMGTGIDLHGRDYTKAARRAVENAIGHNSLNFLRHIGPGRPEAMQVKVLIGVPKPEAVDAKAVLAALPFGTRTLEAVSGGLEVTSEDGRDMCIVANAAVIVSLDLP